MSLILDRSKPETIEGKTYTDDPTVYLRRRPVGGSLELDLEDFLVLARYVMTNTDLSGPDDPRLEFLRQMKLLRRGKGYNPGRKRLIEGA